MSKHKKVVIGVIVAIVAAAGIGIGYFYCTFFPNPLVKSVTPELTEHLDSLEGYQTVILIYPNWLSGLPQPVLSFLEEYDFSGKTIVPIATSQALGLGSGPELMKEACPEAMVEEGLSVRNEKGLKKFLEENGYTSN